jgi:hypothetical protein
MDFTRSDIFSTLALVISSASFAVSWLAHRHKVKAEQPRFWLETAQRYRLDAPGWESIELHVHNHAPFGIVCEGAQILRPKRAKIAGYWDAVVNGPTGRPVLRDDFDAKQFSGRVRLRLAAASREAPLHQSGMIRTYGASAADREGLLVHCAPSSSLWAHKSESPIRLKIRVIWRSKDESSRRRHSDVSMELTPARVSASKAP